MNLRVIFSVIVTCGAAVMAGCATEPVAPPAAPTAATVPSIQAAAITAQPEDNKPVPAGFRRVVRDGTEVFCQSRTYTGSRARVAEICLTRDEIRRMQETSDQLIRDAASSGSHSTLSLDSPN